PFPFLAAQFCRPPLPTLFPYTTLFRSLHRLQRLRQAGGHRLLGQHQGDAVLGEGLRRATVDVPRELVEHDDLGQPAAGIGAPGPQFGAGGLKQALAEADAQLFVEGRIGLPPLRRARLHEPEIQDLRRRRRGGHQRALGGIGKGVTTFSPVLASRMLSWPLRSTSSTRTTLCIGRCSTRVWANSSRRRSSVGSTTMPSLTSNTRSATSVKPQSWLAETRRAYNSYTLPALRKVTL